MPIKSKVQDSIAPARKSWEQKRREEDMSFLAYNQSTSQDTRQMYPIENYPKPTWITHRSAANALVAPSHSSKDQVGCVPSQRPGSTAAAAAATLQGAVAAAPEDQVAYSVYVGSIAAPEDQAASPQPPTAHADVPSQPAAAPEDKAAAPEDQATAPEDPAGPNDESAPPQTHADAPPQAAG